ncbi:MAG: response regulator transcription factor [Pseudomonadales bacterium]|jgi:DNA-binding response OmpR family regulator|nr:response regulator transcription factor [Pseudomonadales bacterium]
MHKILIIDDDQRLAKTLEIALRKLPADVERIDNVKDAKRMSDRYGDFDLVILDRNFPDGDGLEVLDILNADYFQTRVIMLTACDTQAEIEEGLKFGADDYLVKPHSLSELLLRVRNQLSKKKIPSQKVFQIGPVRYYGTSGILRYDDVQQVLRRKENLLFKYFLRNQDQVIKKDELLAMFWGSQQKNRHLVTVYIRRLREKLGPYSKVIKTLHNVGYMFSPEELNNQR